MLDMKHLNSQQQRCWRHAKPLIVPAKEQLKRHADSLINVRTQIYEALDETDMKKLRININILSIINETIKQYYKLLFSFYHSLRTSNENMARVDLSIIHKLEENKKRNGDWLQ